MDMVEKLKVVLDFNVGICSVLTLSHYHYKLGSGSRTCKDININVLGLEFHLFAGVMPVARVKVRLKALANLGT